MGLSNNETEMLRVMKSIEASEPFSPPEASIMGDLFAKGYIQDTGRVLILTEDGAKIMNYLVKKENFSNEIQN